MRENASDTTNKGLISKVYKQLVQLNIKKKNQTTHQKMGRKSKETFNQRRHINCQKAHEKKCNITNY